MIYPAKYNGINFSYDFNRESLTYNFDNQRRKNIVNRDVELKYLSFFYDGAEATPELIVYSKSGSFSLAASITTELTNGWIYYFIIPNDYLFNDDSYCKLTVGTDVIYSEIFEVKNNTSVVTDGICQLIASNNDDRHGYLANQAFGFFKFSKLKSDIFLTKKVEYEYSYSRKKILSAENQIAKRFTFHDLSMYQTNSLKWLCNCENLSIDGTSYQLITDFTELESDPNSEVMSLQADFVEVNQSFFGSPSTKVPTNIFTNNFFM